MQSPSIESNPRTFNPMMAPELSDEARKAVKAVFDAMSTWRADIIKSSGKNCEQVIEKMAAAAQAVGWPEQIVDLSREQLQSITKMQVQTMDHMMDAWEQQLKSPNPMINPSSMLSKLKSLPSLNPAGGWPSAGNLQTAAMNPMQFWIQVAEQWRKGWADAMAFWGKVGKPYEDVGHRRH
jgi:gas vesicle protein